MGYWQIGGLILSSSVVSALVAHGLTWLLDRTRENRVRDFDVMTLCVFLQSYALDCASAVSSCLEWHASKGLSGRLTARIPKLGPFPQAAYSKLDIQLMRKVLDFPVEVEYQISGQAFWAAHDLESMAQEIARRSAKLGLKAHELSTALRLHYKLPQSSANLDQWDYVKLMQDVREKGLP
jgi:hypothetical protein